LSYTVYKQTNNKQTDGDQNITPANLRWR